MKTKKLLITLFAAVTALAAAAYDVGDLAFELYTPAGPGIPMVKCTGLSAAGKTKNTNGTIEGIIIPSGITYSDGNNYRVYAIDQSAFAETKITSVTINWGVYEIGVSAFQNCKKLTTVHLASSVQSLQASGFYGCSALKTVYWCGFGWGNARMATFWPENSGMTLYINYEQTHTIDEFKSDWFWKVFKNVEYNNGSCSDVYLSSSTDKYGYGLTIGESDNKGYGATRAATVTYFTNSYPEIKGRPTSNPSATTYKGVTYEWKYIGKHALPSNSTVTNIDLTNATNLVGIHDLAFMGSLALTKLTLPKSLTSFSISAVDGCKAMTEFAVNSANTSYSAYSGILYNKSQTNLIRVPEGKSGNLSFPSTLKTITNYAFDQCKKVTDVYLPYGITTIYSYAFRGASSLGYVKIPSSVTSLSNSGVFNGVGSSCHIICNMQTPPNVTASTYFGTNSGMTLYVPYGKETTYKNAGWTGFKTVNPDGHQAYDIQSGDFNYTVTSTASTTVNGSSYGGRVKLVCGYRSNVNAYTSYNIPTAISSGGKTYAVTKIGEYAFKNHTSNMVVAGCLNIDTIGYAAFQNQPITSYPFTHTLKYIQDYAFDGAGFTGTVQIPYGVQMVDYFAFAHGKYSRFVLPHGTRHYGNFCANTSTLTELVINTSVDYNYSNWNLTGVPSTCYIRVPMGVVDHYKKGTLKARANYITGGAYDFAYGNDYTGRYYLTITSTSSTTYNGTTYAGTAKYVYHPNIKASTYTDSYGWATSEQDRTVSTDKRAYLITELGDSLLAGVTNFGISNNIPASVKRIAHDAFYSATKVDVSNLKLPDGLTYIGDYAFNSSKLSGEIKIPSSVTYIGKYAFYNMPNLNSIYFESKKPSTLSNYAWGTNNASNFTVWVNNDYAYSFLTAANGWGTSYGDKLSVYVKPLAQNVMFSSVVPVDLQSSNVTGFYASAFNKNNSDAQVTFTRANMAPAHTGLLLVDLDKTKEYRLKRPTNSVSAPMTNYLVAASLNNGSNVDVYSQTVGYRWDFTAATPHFLRPTSSWTIGPGSAYLKLSTGEASGLTEVYSDLWPKPASGLRGDVDGSGIVDVDDVNAIINLTLFYNQYKDKYPGNADLDGNHIIDIDDANIVINLILSQN